MLLLGVTGLLLTWKSELKFSPLTQNAVGNQNLISLYTIEQNAISYIDSLHLDNSIYRIDYRPSKGIAKIRFENHFTELQIDCFSGKIVSVKQRTADIIEMIHDGSIIDYVLKSDFSNFSVYQLNQKAHHFLGIEDRLPRFVSSITFQVRAVRQIPDQVNE